MEFLREKILLNKMIIVDGIGKCGKSLLMNFITAFETVEKIEYSQCLEFIGLVYYYQKISRDAALAILKTEIDTALYNNMIGRNINTRSIDDTSLYKYHTPSKYLKRMLETDVSIIAKKVLEEKPIYLCWTHDLIHKSDIIFEAFGQHLVFFYLNRKPIDIIHEWNQEIYSYRMANDPTEMQYCIQYQNTVVPCIAFGWEEEYLNCNPTERTVKMIYSFLKYNFEALKKKRELNNLHIFNFEDLLQDPLSNIERLKKIVGVQLLFDIMEKILRDSNCPRKIDVTIYHEREKNIRSHISKSYFSYLDDMHDMYEEIYKMPMIMQAV